MPTSFTWNENTLTQHVDLSNPNISFPVVADPAWTYSYKFPTGSKNSQQARALLKKCFNCYFPVTGAPKAFPTAGQKLPLKVGVLNFECTFDKEVYNSLHMWIGFKFKATKNHIDQLGSYVNFTFQPVGGANHLLISAYVVNISFVVNNAFYRSGAIQKWTEFANKIKNG
ncbi:hypothetical protein V5R04_01545 [Jonesiaceae bacterium BS-20]|uniref:Uncharacterized protein n=1 Tax=Jonesiaceae bacterium BS-20 TaxID=3120821 RepID=A0AAU7DVR7_9MICO